MTHEHKLQCKQIFEHYGEEQQLHKLTEEACELGQATMKYILDPTEQTSKALAEEMADVEITLMQIKMAVGESYVDEIVQQKINRQLKRIKNENLSSMPKRI